MADFVLSGKSPPHRIAGIEQNKRTVWQGRLAPLILIGILLVVLGLGTAMLAALYRLAGPWGPTLALLFAGYLYLLRVVLTRA